MKTNQDNLEAIEKSVFYKLFDSTPDAIVVFDNSESINLINMSTEKLFGYSREEVLGKPINIFFHERYMEKFHTYIDSFFNTSIPKPLGIEMDLQGIKKDGSEFPIEVSLGWTELNGKTVIISSIRDQTDRKRLEKELRKSLKILEQKVILKSEENEKANTHLKTTLENVEISQKNIDKLFSISNEMIGIINTDGYFVHLNSNWVDFLGWSLDDLASRPYLDFIHTDSHELLISSMEKIKDDNDVTSLNLRMENIEHQFKEMSWRITKTFKNNSILIVANSLEKEDVKLQSIIDIINSVDEGITLSDKNGNFEIFNLGMEKISGYTIDDTINCDFSTLLYPDNAERQNVLDGLNTLIEVKGFITSDTEIISKDGIKKSLDVSTKVIEVHGEMKFLSIYREKKL